MSISEARGALKDLLELAGYYQKTPRAGHTTALLDGAVASSALVVAQDARHCAQLHRRGLQAVSRNSLSTGLRGWSKPLAVDHAALVAMILDAQQRLDRALDAIENKS